MISQKTDRHTWDGIQTSGPTRFDISCEGSSMRRKQGQISQQVFCGDNQDFTCTQKGQLEDDVSKIEIICCETKVIQKVIGIRLGYITAI